MIVFKQKIFLLILLMIIGTTAPALGTEMPGTFDCELKIQKSNAESFLIACGDGNTMLRKIKWAYWRSDEASGVGLYSWNDCNSNCVTGKIHDVKVKVRLSKPRLLKGRLYLTYLAWWEIVPNGLKRKNGQNGELDLYENFTELGGKL